MSHGVQLLVAGLLGAVVAVAVLEVTRDDTATRRAGGSDRQAALPQGAAGRNLAEIGLRGLELTNAEESWVREQIERERVRREQARIRPTDTGLKIIDRILESQADPSDLLADFDLFQSHVESAPGSAVVIRARGETTEVNLQELAGDTALIEFGPGKFKLGREGREFYNRQESLKHLEIRGAGMDKTVLVLASRDLLMVGKELENLRVRDLTVDGGERGAGTLDIRGGTAAIFENVRFRAWWPSAGYGAPIGFSGRGYLGFRNCEWIGGYLGRGDGTGVAVRGMGLVTFERCLFADLGSVVLGSGGARGGSVIQFRDCTWENSRLTDSRIVVDNKPAYPIDVRGGTAFVESAERWGQKFAAHVSGVTFRPRLPRCTVGLLQDIVRRLPRDFAEQIVSIAAVSPTRDGVRKFVVSVQNSPEFRLRLREQGRLQDSRLVVLTAASGDLVIESARSHRGLPSIQGNAQEAPFERFEETLRKCNLDRNAEAYGLTRVLWSGEKARVPAIGILDSTYRIRLFVDARDGTPLRR